MIRCFSTEIEAEVGLRSACLFNQLHYWLNRDVGKEVAGHRWIWNTMEDWNEQFPNWGLATIKRSIRKLRDAGLIFVRHEKRRMWFTINYEEPLVKQAGYRQGRQQLLKRIGKDQNDPQSDQNDTQTPCKSTGGDQNDPPYTKSTASTKNNSIRVSPPAAEDPDFQRKQKLKEEFRACRSWLNKQPPDLKRRILEWIDEQMLGNYYRDRRAYQNKLITRIWKHAEGLDVGDPGFPYFHELDACCGGV